MITIRLTGRDGTVYGTFTEPSIELTGFTNESHGGFIEARFFFASENLDVSAPEVARLNDVLICEGIETAFHGFIFDFQKNVARSGYDVMCAGYFATTKHVKLQKRYIDARLDRWEERDRYDDLVGSGVNIHPDRFNRDKYNRLYAVLQKDTAYAVDDKFGWMYYAPSDAPAIKRFKAPYATNYNHTYVIARLYAWAGSWTLIWNKAYTGGASGTIDISTTSSPGGDIVAAIPANTTGLLFGLWTLQAWTPNADNWYGKLTAPKVYYETLADYKGDSIIKDFIPNAAELSSDLTNIACDAGDTFELEALWDKRTTVEKMLADINERYLYDYGVWDDKVFHWKKHDTASIDYTVRLDEADDEDISGFSMDEMASKVVVEYKDANGNPLYVEVTDTTGFLATQGYTKEVDIQVDTTDVTEATAAGNAYLNRLKESKGSGTIKTKLIYDVNGAEVSPALVRAWGNVRIDNYVDEDNLFRIAMAEYDHKDRSVTLHLDKKDPAKSAVLLAQIA